MKIVQFTAENVKKLKVVDITPTKDFIQISGKNASGKSSVLDSIWWALAGKEAIPEQPIRKGETKAMIRLDLGECVVTRRFTENGTTLTVENADGFRATSPQAMLTAIMGHLAFDPLEFSRMAPKAQFDSLKNIADVQIDLDQIADEEDKLKVMRAAAHKQVKETETILGRFVVPGDAPDDFVSVSELMNELTRIEQANSVQAALEDKKNRLMQEQLDRALSIQNLKARLNDLEGMYAAASAAIAAMPDIVFTSTDEVKTRIAGAEGLNSAYLAKQQRGEMQNTLKEAQSKAADLEAQVKNLRDLRAKGLCAAKMPIEGLAFGDKCVTFKDLPFEQLSAAEQLRVSVAIAMAANPKLRVIRIKDGSLLDDDSLKIIQGMAAERDYQIWCEVVDSSGKIGIFMEDGAVAAINGGES